MNKSELPKVIVFSEKCEINYFLKGNKHITTIGGYKFIKSFWKQDNKFPCDFKFRGNRWINQ